MVKCSKCGHEIKDKKTLIIKELNIEVQVNLRERTEEEMKNNKIDILEGFRLLTLSELIFIYNNYQNKINWGKDKYFDEIVEQPIKENKYPYYNVWLRRLGGVSGLDGDDRYWDGDLADGGGARGVRFCRDLKRKVEK